MLFYYYLDILNYVQYKWVMVMVGSGGGGGAVDAGTVRCDALHRMREPMMF